MALVVEPESSLQGFFAERGVTVDGVRAAAERCRRATPEEAGPNEVARKPLRPSPIQGVVVFGLTKSRRRRRLRLFRRRPRRSPAVPSSALPFSRLASSALARSLGAAQVFGHENIGPEHILLALFGDSEIAQVEPLAPAIGEPDEGHGVAADVLEWVGIKAEHVRVEVLRLHADDHGEGERR
jgi:hypothetical protein